MSALTVGQRGQVPGGQHRRGQGATAFGGEPLRAVLVAAKGGVESRRLEIKYLPVVILAEDGADPVADPPRPPARRVLPG